MKFVLAFLVFSHVEVYFAFGQNYLERLWDYGAGELGGRVVLTDSNIYVYGISQNQHGRFGLFIKMDVTGDTLLTRWFRPDSSDYWGASFKLVPDSTLILGGSLNKAGTVGFTNHMAKWTYNGDTVWSVTWKNDTLSDIMRDAIILDDGRIAVFGSRSNPSIVRGGIYYTLLDDTGSILLDTMVTGFNYFDDPSSATLLPNGNMAVLFRRNKLKPIDSLDYDIRIIEINSAGDVLRNWEYDTPMRAWGGGLTPDPSGTRIIVSGTIETVSSWQNPDGGEFSLYLAVLDSQFNIVYDTLARYINLRTQYLWNHLMANNGDIILVATVGIGPGTNRRDYGWLARLDPQFNLKWSRTYTSNPAHHNYLYDLKEDRDGNLVAVGSGYGQTQDLWIIRTDSAGCLVPNCDSLTWAGPEHQPFQINLYPNPVQHKLTVTLPELSSGASITVFDISGRRVYEATRASGEYSISTTAWPLGIYLVQVATPEGRWSGKVVKE